MKTLTILTAGAILAVVTATGAIAQNKQASNCGAVGVNPSIQILELAESIGPSGFK